VAAVSLLERLNGAFGFNIDVKALQEQAEEFRLRLRELMQRTQQSMRAMKSQEEELPALYG
jgi:predicted ATP-grasp superfamily ATP-dependent carboligase